MNVLLIGSGGREHAIAWKITQSNLLDDLYIAPGNAGTSEVGTNVDLNIKNFKGVKDFILTKNIKMVIVGPEVPLVDGLHDRFLEDDLLKDIPVIGPVKKGAMLEGSKDFANKFMLKYGIPTAGFKTFKKESIVEAYSFLESLQPPYVIKADGLAAGKGVVICQSIKEAKSEVKEMLEAEKFGTASSKVVIEEFLNGIEVSVFVLTDGDSYIILPEAKDYKRIGEGDTGLNTGGMGSISPVPFADSIFMNKVEQRIIKPTIEGLKKEGIEYKGFILFGLISVKNEPFVIEYNVRMDDPEAESVIPRIKSDLMELFLGVAEGTISEKTIETDPRTAAAVFLVSGGYPGTYENGKPIHGLNQIKDSIIFHAGTKANINTNEILTNGGRVLAICSFGDNIKNALNTSFSNAEVIDFENKYYRKDLGFDLV